MGDRARYKRRIFRDLSRSGMGKHREDMGGNSRGGREVRVLGVFVGVTGEDVTWTVAARRESVFFHYLTRDPFRGLRAGLGGGEREFSCQPVLGVTVLHQGAG